MQPGWILGMWVAAGAAMLGVLVAAITGASAPSWWILALLVALPGAITIAVRYRYHARRSEIVESLSWEGAAANEPDTGRGERPAPQRAAAARKPRSSSRSIASADWDVVSEICCALETRQLDWLRSSDFVTPWLDDHGRTVVELEPLVTQVIGRPFGADFRTALGTLADALGAFNEYYLDYTRTDPLVLGGEWRFLRPDDAIQDDEDVADGGALAGRQAHLQHLAIGVARAYDRFKRIASRNPNVRRRNAARR
jgi:hypothetical protein